MVTQRAKPASIDEYIAAFPPDVQAILRKVRQVVRSAAPGAEEAISYQIPAFKLSGMLVYFAAFKGHIGFYPPVRGDACAMSFVVRMVHISFTGCAQRKARAAHPQY